MTETGTISLMVAGLVVGVLSPFVAMFIKFYSTSIKSLRDIKDQSEKMNKGILDTSVKIAENTNTTTIAMNNSYLKMSDELKSIYKELDKEIGDKINTVDCKDDMGRINEKLDKHDEYLRRINDRTIKQDQILNNQQELIKSNINRLENSEKRLNNIQEYIIPTIPHRGENAKL